MLVCLNVLKLMKEKFFIQAQLISKQTNSDHCMTKCLYIYCIHADIDMLLLVISFQNSNVKASNFIKQLYFYKVT